MSELKRRHWLWAFICTFLFFWLGDQLLHALFTAEIMDIRTTHLISFHQQPLWFAFVVLVKCAFFIGSTVFIYFQFIKRSYR